MWVNFPKTCSEHICGFWKIISLITTTEFYHTSPDNPAPTSFFSLAGFRCGHQGHHHLIPEITTTLTRGRSTDRLAPQGGYFSFHLQPEPLGSQQSLNDLSAKYTLMNDIDSYKTICHFTYWCHLLCYWCLHQIKDVIFIICTIVLTLFNAKKAIL